MVYYDEFSSPIGNLKIFERDGKIVEIAFEKDEVLNAGATKKDSEVIKQCKKELEEYFLGVRKSFSLEIIQLQGTEFQLKVWNELLNIPYGEVVSYKYIAENIGSPKGYRAVGNANNKNPIPIIVPCHRVVGSDKKLVGYAGGLDIKEFLLKLENLTSKKK